MNIGYHRFKISNLNRGKHTFDVYKNGELVATHTVYVKDFCPNYILLKYLDRNGFYRFFPFNANWEKNIDAKDIGDVDNVILSLRENPRKDIGKEYSEIISLVAENVTPDELEALSDIYISPCVYIYNNSGQDRQQDWQKVKVLDSGISRNRKTNPKKITITIELNKRNAITLL